MVSKTKRIYLLPHNDTYSLIDSFHTGGIEGEGYTMCDNCRALISRVAVIKSTETNITNHVGFDCAKTLTSIKQQDIENHLAMFKMGESIRKSFLNYFKQTTICKVSIKEKDSIAYFSMDSNNNSRLWFSKELTINDSYRKYIAPQITDLEGIFIRQIRINEFILNELINHMAIGMEINKSSYYQRINNINITHNKIILDDLYMKDSKSTSTKPVLSVLGDLLHTEPFKELLIKFNLTK